MRTWHIVLRSENGDVSFNFIDIIDATLQLLRTDLIDRIVDNADTYEHYNISSAISRIVSPEGEDMTDRQIYVLLAKSKEYGISVGYLLGELRVNGGTALAIIGLWPPEFAELMEKSKDNKLYLRALASIVMEPNAWESVDLVFPT